MGLRCLGLGRAVSYSSAPLLLPRRHSVRTLACSSRRTIATTTTALPAPSSRCARTAPAAWTAARACRERRPLRRRGPPLVLATRTTPSTRMGSWAPTAPTTAQANRYHRRRPAQPPCVPALASARRRVSTTPIATKAAPAPSSRCPSWTSPSWAPMKHAPPQVLTTPSWALYVPLWAHYAPS